MTESIGWLALSLLCAVTGGALGAALLNRRARRADQARSDRDR